MTTPRARSRSHGRLPHGPAAHRPARRASGVLALVALVALACGEEPAPPEPVVRPVKIVEFASDEGATTREYPGRVQATERSELAFEVAGRIVEFPVKEGQRIQKGTVIAKLDTRDYVSNVEAERANLGAARAEYERQRILFEEDVAPKQQLEKAQRNYEVAQSRVATAEKALEEAVLRAPFDGVIGQKLVDDFANVQAKEPVVSLQGQSDAFEVVVDLPEQDALRARPQEGRPVTEERRVVAQVVFPGFSDREIPAWVTEFAAKADPVTRTFRVTLGFERPADMNVLPGMTAKVRVRMPKESGLARGDSLPARAVVSTNDGEPFVWVVDPQAMTVSRRLVALGEPFGDRVEIRSGLRPGEWVVVSGVHQLGEGMTVRRLAD